MASTEALPSVDGYPLVGIVPSYVRDPFACIDDIASRGDVVEYRFGYRRFVGVYHPDPVETVLVTEAAKFRKPDFLRQSGVEFLENGLFLSEGEQWGRQRSLLQPMFFLDRIRSYGETMVDHTRHVVDEWDDGEVVGLRDELSRLTLRILAETLLGVDIREERERTITRLSDAILEVSSPTSPAAFLPPWVPSLTRYRFRRAVGEFEDLVDELLTERRDGDPSGDDLLGLMATAEFEDGSRMDDETIRDQLMTFLLAGHETSSLALTFTLFYLGQYPGPRERAVAEARDAAEDRLGPADVPDLTAVEWAIKEAMRLRPPAHVLFRQTEEPVTLAGHRIEEGVPLTLSAYHVHNDEEWYDDPDEYRPSRWADGLEEDLPDYAYFPFGGGPRHCIGMRFAMLEMQLVLGTVLRSVEFELVTDPDDVGLTPATTLRPDSEIRVRIRK
ncbi:cytochrome P450 [Halobacteriales archaeon QS_8_69_26]|nr:MAG: cytochrome P450 [Halobacteriales archaeon QS_8_69_26]